MKYQKIKNLLGNISDNVPRCKFHLELNWNNNCVMYSADTYAGGDNSNNRETTVQITSTKLYDSVVTLSTENR